MRLYAITALGDRIRKDRSGDSEVLRVLDYLYENKTASQDQLEVGGADIFTLKSMARHGLIQELTQ